jgi:hypothetical protein
MKDTTLTLVMYWSISAALIAGGLYALHRGFKLLMSSRGRKAEENTIEAFGMKFTLGSLGSLVMITAFLWGFAAAWALPNYKDRDTTITNMQLSLEEKTRTIQTLQTDLSMKDKELVAVKTQLGIAVSELTAVRDRQSRLVADQKQQLTQVTQRLEDLQSRLGQTTRIPTDGFREEKRIVSESLMDVRATLKKLDQ